MYTFDEDLLNLCRLNLMEETVLESAAQDREATLTAIEWKKRQLSGRLCSGVYEEITEGNHENYLEI